MNAVGQFLKRIRKNAVRRPGEIRTVAMGRERAFVAYDLGSDTFVFEVGVSGHLGERPSVLVVEKRDLGRRTAGRVMTITSGNHSVAAFPLLDGRFWKLSSLPSAKRGEVLMGSILCANIIGSTIETSQRDVPSKKLYAADEWLLGPCGFALNDIVMGDRNEATMQHYRELGQEWRVKPLAWTEAEMKVALASSKRRIATKVNYYHSSRGVHFLSFAEFKRGAELAETNPEEFQKCVKELVSVYEGQRYSFARMPKYRGHHEIELFGLRRGVSVERVIPEIEKLMEAIVLHKADQTEILRRVREIVGLYESLLSRPELADETSKVFTETLYMHITGEIYSVMGEGSTPAFDDRRTALPGATYVLGRPVYHPGVDERSEILLSNLRGLMSKDEIVLYANVYEIREDDSTAIGSGKTREIVYRTNRRPLENSLIEKRLSSAKKAYGSYLLSRIGAMRSLGISLAPNYILLRRRVLKGRRAVDFYIRDRCEGEPISSIPANYFCNADDASVEETSVVLALARLMGDAAAQNMAMKRFDPKTFSPLFGVGKEIYEFEYDIVRQRVVPKMVRTCSLRGSFGWPDLEFTEENLSRLVNFYLAYYAHALKTYQRQHGVSMLELATQFMDGFEFRTNALSWQLSVMRDQFEEFNPKLPRSYNFKRKWDFIMWSLERQERRLPMLRQMFFRKVAIVEENRSIADTIGDGSEK